MTKREQVLQATLELVTARGFHGTTTALIAERASVGTGTIYRYFKSKEELLNALFEEAKERLKTHILSSDISQLTTKEAFFLLLHRLFDYYLQNPLWFSFTEQYRHSPFISDATRSALEEVLQPVLVQLERAITLGEIKDLPPRMLVNMFHGVVVGLVKATNAESITLSRADKVSAIQVCWLGISK